MIRERPNLGAIWVEQKVNHVDEKTGEASEGETWDAPEVLVEIMKATVFLARVMASRAYSAPPLDIDITGLMMLQIVVDFTNGKDEKHEGNPYTITLPTFTVGEIPMLPALYFAKMEPESEKGKRSGEYMDVMLFRLRAISRPSGACNGSGKDGRKREGDFILINRMSKDNNCFFTSARELFPELMALTRWPMRNWCNARRKEFGLTAGAPISSTIAIAMLKLHAKGEWRVHSFDLANGFEESTEGKAHEIRLDEGHWTKVESSPQSRCEECGRRYYDRHKCSEKRKAFFAAKIKYLPPGEKRPRFVLPSKKKEEEEYEHIIHFDLETMPGPDKVHRAYSVGYVIGAEYREKVGSDCMREFIADIEEVTSQEEGGKWFLNAYNGSRFDFFPLLRELLDQGKHPQFTLQGGAIIILEWGNIKCFDLLKHCAGDLKTNLKNAGCVTQKGEVDHDEIARYGSYEAIPKELKDKISQYLRADVMGLKELYEKLNHVVAKEDGVNLTSAISTSQLTYECWTKEAAKKHVIQLPMLEQEPAFRAAVLGARCYKTSHGYTSKDYEDYRAGRVKFDEIKDYQCFIDVVSLYPASMAHNEYPVGKCLRAPPEVLELVGEGTMPIGIYLIDYIANKKLLHAPCGYRDPKTKSLSWDLLDRQGVWRTSVDIENMRTRGYTVVAHDGWYWEKTAPIFRGYIERLFKAKAEAEKDTPEYTVAKLKMNGLYGKMIQRPILEKTEVVTNNAEYWKFWGKNQITDLTELGDDWLVSGIPRAADDKERCVTKPTHLGAFILAYSRRIMLEYMEEANPEGIVEDDWGYMDTDSLELPSRCAARIKRYNGGTLGDIDDDLGRGAKVLKSTNIAPKLYEKWFALPPGTIATKKGKIIEGAEEGGDGVITKKGEVLKDAIIVKNGDIFRKFAGKGLDKADLSAEKFEAMAAGEKVSTTRTFSMKKVCVQRRGDLERSVPQFSVVMLRKGFSDEETRRLTRVANRKAWAGRVFDDQGRSKPIGGE